MDNMLLVFMLGLSVIVILVLLFSKRRPQPRVQTKTGLILTIFSLLLPLVKEHLDKRRVEKEHVTLEAEVAHYSKKRYLMTQAEHHVFEQLMRLAGQKYYVFPQVNYSKILFAQGQQNFRNPWFSKIEHKSADFLLCDKQDISPVLVVEHDDKTHTRPERMERDRFVDDILGQSGIPIIHIRPFEDDEELYKQISSKVVL